MTLLSKVYDAFFSQITDDMYMEISEEQTKKDCRTLLNTSLPLFEFPIHILTIIDDVDIEGLDVSYFDQDLTLEEINILATGMVQIWLQRQITSVEIVRQKFTGSDFRMTSQASHLRQLNELIAKVRAEHYRLQALYSRREIFDGKIRSTFYKLVH